MGKERFTVPPSVFVLFAGIAAYVVLWALFPHALNPSDPLIYSRNAYLLSTGEGFARGDIFVQRVGVSLPVAIVYAIFGVNILTTNVWPLCAALIVLVTVWAALPDEKSRIFGVFLCLTSVPLFDGATALYPDLIATAFMALSSLILFSRNAFISCRGRWMVMPAVGVAVLFLAFLAKESAYWVLPLWIIAFVSDMRGENRRFLLRRFYLPVFVAGVLLIGAYLAFCAAVWGDPLIRVKTVQSYTGRHLWSWGNVPLRELVMRVTVSPFALFLVQYDAICIAAVLALFVLPRRLVSWALYTVCCVGFFWFGSTSFTAYEPMPLSQRMTLPALPGLYVLSAYFLSRLEIPSPRRAVRHLLPAVMILGAVGFPFLHYAASWGEMPRAREHAAAMMKQEVMAHPERRYAVVCSDTRSPSSLAFYFGYRYPENLVVVFAGDVTPTLLDGRERYAFVDGEQSAFLLASYGDANFDGEIRALGLPCRYRSGNIALYADNRDLLMKFAAERTRRDGVPGG